MCYLPVQKSAVILLEWPQLSKNQHLPLLWLKQSILHLLSLFVAFYEKMLLAFL